MATSPTSLVSIADIVSKLSPMFLGSGKTTETTGSSGTPKANANLQDLIDSANSNASDPSKTADVVQNILDQAAKAFAPTLAEGNSAGIYNSTTMNLLNKQAQGAAAAQSSKAVLDYKTKQQDIAQAASGNLVNANRTVAATKVTAPQINPMSALMTVGGGFALNKASKLLGVDKVVDSSGQWLQDNVGSPIQDALGIGPAAASPAGIASMSPEAAFAGATSAPSIDLASTLGDTAAGIPSSLVDTSATSLIGDGASSALDTAGAIGDLATSASGDVAQTASSTALDGLASTAGDVASSAGDAATSAAGWIVCTELVRQNRMPRRYWISGMREFLEYSDVIKRGYYLLAIPAVEHLRRHPYSRTSCFLSWLFNRRVEYLAAKAGTRGARKTVIGAGITYGLLPIGWILGTFIQREMPEWERIYSHG